MTTSFRSLLARSVKFFTYRRSFRKSFRQQGAPRFQSRLFMEALEDRRLLAADIMVTKTASPEPALPGGPLSYTIVVQNIGDTAGTTQLVDNFPAAFTG